MADDEPHDLNERLQATMIAIGKHFEHEDYEKALPLCQKAGDVRPDCPILRRCRVFCLLSLNRWADALQTCEKLACNEEPFAFEKAYCLYRLNKFSEALKALGATGQAQEKRNRRLEAQIRYRMGDYAACADMYERMFDDDPQDSGLLVNALASAVSGDKPGRAAALMAGKEEMLEGSYELCFNLACALIEEGRLEEAEAKLQEAKRLCTSELMEAEDDGDEEEGKDDAQLQDHEELAAINVQTAVVLQRVGRPGARDQANDIYTRVLKPRGPDDGPIDPTVLAVASNNLVSLRQEGTNLFDSVKRVDFAAKEAQEMRLTTKQALEVNINRILLMLQGRRLEPAKTELQKLGEQLKDHPRLAVLQAAVAFRERKAKGAEEVLQGYLAQHPGCDEILICMAQLQAQQKDRLDKAAEALEQLSRASRAQPRNAELIVSFHQRQKCPEKAVACLREAIKYWSGEDGGEDNEGMLGQVLRMASKVAAQVKDKEFAAHAFQLYLERVDGSDAEALCGLVRALASVDPERATEYAQRLKVPDYAHFDPEELESQAAPKMSRLAKGGAEASDQKAEKGKKPRKRKPRYPKSFDKSKPGPPPDPERWLPKMERSEYKKKMRKRDKILARGPQGASCTDDKAFRKTGPSTAQIEVTSESAARPKGTKSKKGGNK